MAHGDTSTTKRLALRLVQGNRGEYHTIHGDELLCLAAQAAHDILSRGLARVPITDPLRPEIEARVSRLRVPGECALPAEG